MAQILKAGMIGLDTSHVPAFTKLFNDPKDPDHLPGVKVVVGLPGASDKFDVSYTRVDKFTKDISEQFGVEIVDSAEAVAERSDIVFITAVDGRTHRDWFERTAPFGRPTFVDKPFATTTADAKSILRLAEKSGAPVMSCSALRYAENFQAALADAEKGAIVGCDAFGPMEIRAELPGLFWYGCHAVEMMIAAMGAGCCQVRAFVNEKSDLISAEWSDGRTASIRGLRGGHSQFGIVLHREKGAQFVDITANKKPYYASLLAAVVRSLPKGRSDVPPKQMLEVVRFIEAANESRETGLAVTL